MVQPFRLLLLWICVALTFPTAYGQTSPGKPFIIASDGDPEGFGFRYATLVYEDAFRRLGIPVKIETYPLARRSALAAEGAIDGEDSRVAAYASAHPELIRVDESIFDITFTVYSANPALVAQRVDELPKTSMIEYRRGILICENELRKSIPPERLSTITTSEQGIRKLLAGRSDAYCDVDFQADTAMNSLELKGASNVRKLFNIAVLPTYPYLFRRHAELAPRLAAMLKKMKAEGLLTRYRNEAERGAAGSR